MVVVQPGAEDSAEHLAGEVLRNERPIELANAGEAECDSGIDVRSGEIDDGVNGDSDSNPPAGGYDDPASIVPGISTGSLSLDLALGGRGIPRGRVVEIFGPESSGKTTLTLSVVASAQKEGGVAAFIDAEHALDPSWARRVGVN